MADQNNQNGDAFGEFGVPLHTIEKRNNEQIRFSIQELNGREFIDIRTFAMIQDGFRPTRKGVTLAPSLFPELLRGILEIGGALGAVSPETLANLDDTFQSDKSG